MSTAARAARAPARLQAAAHSWPAELAGSSNLVELARSRVISAASREAAAAGVTGVLDRHRPRARRGGNRTGDSRPRPSPLAPSSSSTAESIASSTCSSVVPPADAVERDARGRPGGDRPPAGGLLTARGGTLAPDVRRRAAGLGLPAALARLMRDGEARISGSGRAERLSLPCRGDRTPAESRRNLEWTAPRGALPAPSVAAHRRPVARRPPRESSRDRAAAAA